MSMYKECDIRGIYQEEITETDALLIGKAIGTILKGSKIVVAGDARYSTKSLKEALIEGLLSTGAKVLDIGMVPTPLLYFAKKVLQADGGVMVTASHNPAQYNGFKIALSDASVEPKDINEIEALVQTQEFKIGQGSYEAINIQNQYLNMIDSFIPKNGHLKIVVDCGNGAASEIAPFLLERMGHNVIPLYCECKGDFPNRDPNPSVEKNLKDLKVSVVIHEADIGIAFDGDGDRVIFVDDKGRFCDSEATFVLFCRYYLDKEGSGSIVYDGKSSSIVPSYIKSNNGTPLPERSGHAFIKKRFLDEGSILAGEVSGHFFFKELGHDDGLYGALKFTQILIEMKTPLSTIMDSIDKPIITPDIRVYIDSDERDTILKHVEELGAAFTLSYLDGVRVDYPYGWIVVRKSVTEPCVTIRVEGDSIEDVDTISTHLFKEKYSEVDELIRLSIREK